MSSIFDSLPSLIRHSGGTATVNGTREHLAKLIVERSYIHLDKPGDEPVTLSSGEKSKFYFECQKTTRFAEAMPLIGELFLERMDTVPASVGGLASGADPIAQAIAHTSIVSERWNRGFVNSFSVRKQRKEHGTMRWIEGCVDPGSSVIVVDDVITSGGSVIKAIDRCQEEGLPILQVIVLVDREAGGLQNIKSRIPGVRVEPIFTKTQLDQVDAEARGCSHPGLD